MLPRLPQMHRMPVRAAELPPAKIKPEMPPLLQEQIALFNSLAKDNLKNAQRDQIWFWLIKISAALASGSAGFFAYLKWDLFGIVIGLIGGVIILVKDNYPVGILHSVHREAHFDFGELGLQLENEWGLICMKESDPAKRNNLIIPVLESTREKKKEIVAYIKRAESWGGKKDSA